MYATEWMFVLFLVSLKLFCCVVVVLRNVLHGDTLGATIVSEWTSIEAKLTNVVDVVAGRRYDSRGKNVRRSTPSAYLALEQNASNSS